MANRRKFLKSLSVAPAVAGLAPAAAAAAPKRDYFKDLGVRPLINAAGTYTMFTASLMQPEVMDAINYASKHFVRLSELHDAVGKRIAELLGAEAAMVSAGAASALTLGTAGVLTGMDQKKVLQLPDLTGLKSEVIVQKSHRVGYDHAIRNCGVKLIEVETRDQLLRAINEKTAMMFFLNWANNDGQVKDQEFAQIGLDKGIPTMTDCAADSLPLENMTRFNKMGFSLVIFSGGKGIRGPQSAGVLMGKKEIIAAARLNGPPNGDTIGRGMKVNKEELLGMMVAVETFMKRDHAADWKEWERRVALIGDAAKSIPSVKAEQYVPAIANHVPHLRLTWDPAKVKLSYKDVAVKLREGDPSIEVVPGSNKDSLEVGVWMLQPGEDKIVARRLREVLKG
ncbi:MAG: aminotransferase class V-fold PLP-dependent enzyme [Acidobacteriaceae bacterium]|jgi:L-seryl-tRNA(Ser) seleniumtransferase|nr:aminotransferase class V-fold PLP-dependent enzyme [Acidobacteriaceae bacterium]